MFDNLLSSKEGQVVTVFRNLPMTKRILNTADPTIVPIPTSLNAMKTPIMDVNNSGADPPAAMKVAPATSSETPKNSIIASNEGTKNSSHTMARATNIYMTPEIELKVAISLEMYKLA